MTKKLLILLFLFVKITGNAQTNQKHSLNEFVSDFIKTQKTDTLFAYESFHAGDLKIIDYSSDDGKEVCFDDLTNHPIYIFWKEKGKTYFSKINYCYEYSNILIENDTFWEIYSSNKSIIENEKVKPFQYIAIEKSKKTKYTIGVGNSYFQILQIITNGKKTQKLFDKFDLQKQDEKLININYQNNINLKSKLIVDILEKITSEAEKNNTFKKIKSR